ncbi:MAG: hypothetical protein ACOX08_11725 [Methanobacterium sp.]
MRGDKTGHYNIHPHKTGFLWWPPSYSTQKKKNPAPILLQVMFSHYFTPCLRLVSTSTPCQGGGQSHNYRLP